MRNPKFTFKEFCWIAAGVCCALWAIWALGKEGLAAQDTAAAAGIWAMCIFMHVSSGGCHTESLQQGEVKQLLTQETKGGTQGNLRNYFMRLSIR